MNLESKKSLYDILQAAKAIEVYTSCLQYVDFLSNDLVQAAVERKFEIIGEALNRIRNCDESVIEQISDYQRIIGFRNIIAHGYDVVDSEIVWEAVTDYLPVLVVEVEDLLE